MQLVMQYGKNKSNGQLALDYGFVECSSMRSAVRDSFMLTVEIPESDRFYGDKLDIAELNGLDTTVYFDLIYGEGLPENMLPYLRLIALNGTDAFLLEALFRNSVWDHLQLPISQENEEAVCNMILEGCNSALAGYPTSINEVRISLSLYTYIHTYIDIYTYKYTYINTYVYIHTPTYTHIHICIICECMNAYVCKCVFIYVRHQPYSLCGYLYICICNTCAWTVLFFHGLHTTNCTVVS